MVLDTCHGLHGRKSIPDKKSGNEQTLSRNAYAFAKLSVYAFFRNDARHAECSQTDRSVVVWIPTSAHLREHWECKHENTPVFKLQTKGIWGNCNGTNEWNPHNAGLLTTAPSSVSRGMGNKLHTCRPCRQRNIRIQSWRISIKIGINTSLWRRCRTGEGHDRKEAWEVIKFYIGRIVVASRMVKLQSVGC